MARFIIIADVYGPEGNHVAHVLKGPAWARGATARGRTPSLAYDRLLSDLKAQYPKHSFQLEPNTL